MAKRKKRYKKCRRAKTRWQGAQVVLPCGARTLSPAHKRTIDAQITQSDWNKAIRAARAIRSTGKKAAKCRVVFFTGRKVGVRCAGRKLKAHNRRQCRKGGKGWKKLLGVQKRRRKAGRSFFKPSAHLFTRC